MNDLSKINYFPHTLTGNHGQAAFGDCKQKNDFLFGTPLNLHYLCRLKFKFMDAREKKQLLLDSRYLRMTQIWAENSYCRRRQVGALLVKDKMIISDGYNGTPAGFENVCEEEGEDRSKPYVLHAEANAITKVARSNNSSDGATLYVTTSPCMECSKLIIQAGIRRVVFGEYYRMHDGVDLLCRAGIEIIHLWHHDGEYEPIEITTDNSESHYQVVAKYIAAHND